MPKNMSQASQFVRWREDNERSSCPVVRIFLFFFPRLLCSEEKIRQEIRARASLHIRIERRTKSSEGITSVEHCKRNERKKITIDEQTR